MTTPTWHTRAACHDTNPAIFYADLQPEGLGGRPRTTNYEAAHTYCTRCPVLHECRTYIDAWEHGHETYGYWADETPKARERRRELATLEQAS